MVLLIGILIIIASVILEACGKDWVQHEKNADRRARYIAGAIHSSTSEITSCYERIMGQQIDFYEKMSEDLKKEKEFQDDHGRWFRQRFVYDDKGNIIAQEIIGIEK